MKREFLGDSYDAVKRMWCEVLAPWAPLYAELQFFPDEQLRRDFTKLTGIQMLTDKPKGNYSILNDPDTGIIMPGAQNPKVTSAHVTIDFIASQLPTKKGCRCVITFDQSDYRNSGQSREEQRRAKMCRLADEGLRCFYYVSHAPFLFAASDAEAMEEL